MKYYIIILGVFFSYSCSFLKHKTCTDVSHLKYEIIREGFIGVDEMAQAEMCFQRKKEEYVGLSKDCLIELLGEPAEVREKHISYYFGDPKYNMIIGKAKFYIRGNKVRKVVCVLV